MCPMCRATVGELYVPPEPVPEQVRVTTVHVEDFGAHEHCRQRGTQLSCVACIIAFVILLIVVIRIIMGN